jgi:hypothetical protein
LLITAILGNKVPTNSLTHSLHLDLYLKPYLHHETINIICVRIAIYYQQITNFAFLSRKFERVYEKKLAEYYEIVWSAKIKSMQDIPQKSLQIFEVDKNVGLVSRVVEAKKVAKICELTKVYRVMRLDDIAKKVDGISTSSSSSTSTGTGTNVKGVEEILRRMILDGRIDAKINMKDGTVEFSNQMRASEQDVEYIIDSVQTLGKSIELLQPLYAKAREKADEKQQQQQQQKSQQQSQKYKVRDKQEISFMDIS